MDTDDPAFIEFKGYWLLSEEMIANATKENLAETARILSLQVAHFARKCGEHDLPDLAHLLSAISLDEHSIGLLKDGAEALVGVLAIVNRGIDQTSDVSIQ